LRFTCTFKKIKFFYLCLS